MLLGCCVASRRQLHPMHVPPIRCRASAGSNIGAHRGPVTSLTEISVATRTSRLLCCCCCCRLGCRAWPQPCRCCLQLQQATAASCGRRRPVVLGSAARTPCRAALRARRRRRWTPAAGAGGRPVRRRAQSGRWRLSPGPAPAARSATPQCPAPCSAAPHPDPPPCMCATLEVNRKNGHDGWIVPRFLL